MQRQGIKLARQRWHWHCCTAEINFCVGTHTRVEVSALPRKRPVPCGVCMRPAPTSLRCSAIAVVLASLNISFVWIGAQRNCSNPRPEDAPRTAAADELDWCLNGVSLPLGENSPSFFKFLVFLKVAQIKFPLGTYFTLQHHQIKFHGRRSAPACLCSVSLSFFLCLSR